MKDYQDRLSDLRKSLPSVNEMVEELYNCIINYRNIWIIGNGGSAATAEHFETDLLYARRETFDFAIRAFALSANSAKITALCNDLGSSEIFSKQLERRGLAGDVCVFISASGNSENLLRATIQCKKMGIRSLALLGFDGGKLFDMVDVPILIKSEIGEYGIVEDIHLSLCHEVSEKLLIRIGGVR